MKNICVVTSSRAEFGLLKPLISKLQSDSAFNTTICVTGMHLEPLYGNTVKEIYDSKLKNIDEVYIPVKNSSSVDVLYTMADALKCFANYFSRNSFDLLIVLGDRYEIFSICTVASMLKIPIAHIHGGETTEGATDEFLRHGITKMSFIHFTACDEYRKRVIQLGEAPDRVYNVGALGVENIMCNKILDEKEIRNVLQIDNKPYILLTYHPATMNDDAAAVYEINIVLKAVEQLKDFSFIITKANSDSAGNLINDAIEEFSLMHSHVRYVASLGLINYLSAMKYCYAVMGNSSSGIIEAPVLNVPTVNIGDRQKGRLQAGNIINCKADCEEILKAVYSIESKEFRKRIKGSKSLFGAGNTSSEIVSVLKKFLNEKICLKKEFYNL